MENNENRAKTKLSDKIISTIIILALIIGAGYYAYMHFVIEPQRHEIPDVEGIETYEILNDNHRYEGDYLEITEIAEAMENSDANYFIGEADSEYPYFTTLVQTDKTTFENTFKKASPLTICKRAIADLKMVFDADYTTIMQGKADDQIDELENDGFPNAQGAPMWFNDGEDGLINYLIDHEVKLQCESIKVNKIAAADRNGEAPVHVIGIAEVTTVNANGNISEFGIFGNQGETVTIYFTSKGWMTGDNRIPFTIGFTMERVE